MSRRATAAALALGLLAACATSKGRPVERPDPRRAHRMHVVQPGESAWKIAQAYGVTLDALVALNRLEDPSLLHPGDELLIPGEGAEPTSAPTPPPPPPRGPQPPDMRGDPRPGPRTCEAVEPWLAPPEAVSDAGFSWPVDGVIITKFGKEDGLPHEGIDVAAPLGTAIRASADGEVAFAGVQGGFGNLVVLRHARGLVSVYAHNHVNCVEAGQKVGRGEVLGLVGTTGGTQSPYVYFEVREGKRAINPRVVLPP